MCAAGDSSSPEGRRRGAEDILNYVPTIFMDLRINCSFACLPLSSDSVAPSACTGTCMRVLGPHAWIRGHCIY